MKRLIFLITIIAMVSCTEKKAVQDSITTDTRHSSLLLMQNLDDGLTLCRIINPWKNDETLAQYLLVPENSNCIDAQEFESIEKRFGDCILIHTPLRRMALTSSCHGYLLSQLGALDNVAVYCDAEYVEYASTKEKIANSQIINGGSSLSPNIETILSQRCDAIWISPFENATAGNIAALPLTIIHCADYMEYSPLGRAEWMRFYGRLVGKGAEADSLFNVVEVRYNAIKEKNQERDSITIFAELPYQATWYVPGGNSTMGIMYRDAGYRYVWADDDHSGSLALSAEIVLEKAQYADCWVIKYMSEKDYELEDLLSQNDIYRQFKASQTGNVFGCNTNHSDFYDVMPFRPDSLLHELQNLGNGSYFKRLK